LLKLDLTEIKNTYLTYFHFSLMKTLLDMNHS